MRTDHLAHDLARKPILATDRFDRLLLNKIRASDLRDRLHHQHPRPDPHVPMGVTVDPPSGGARLDADHPLNGVLIRLWRSFDAITLDLVGIAWGDACHGVSGVSISIAAWFADRGGRNCSGSPPRQGPVSGSRGSVSRLRTAVRASAQPLQTSAP